MEIFTDEFLKEIGFTPVECSGAPRYGKAISNRPKGKRIISWNNEGYSIDYFGNKLEPNVAFVIEEDCGTRTVFNGCAYSQDETRLILKLIQ
jgi:hypothetical protein